MASVSISTIPSAPFGAMTSRAVSQLIQACDQIQRLEAAVANAASGYSGTAGVEYENNQFGVVSNATAGQQGAAFAYAVGTLNTAVTTFLSSAAGALAQLDQGA